MVFTINNSFQDHGQKLENFKLFPDIKGIILIMQSVQYFPEIGLSLTVFYTALR